jgi:hypothetical protein
MGMDEERPSGSQPAQEQARVNRKGKRKILWTFLALTLVLAVGLTLGLVLRNRGSSSEESPVVEQESLYPINVDDTIPSPASSPSAPWPHEESDIPKDPNLRAGRLENGLRYMILRNPWPESQVSLRLHIDAGSLMEDDDQLGCVCKVFRLLLQAIW